MMAAAASAAAVKFTRTDETVGACISMQLIYRSLHKFQAFLR